MHKIYPPPFNKFVIFIFYGLLSIAVIVTAQGTNYCVVDPVGNTTNRKIIGYVQPSIDPNTIQWQLYDYINIIVSDFNFGNIINQTTALINAKNGNKTKILLSIRNYDLSAWSNNNLFYTNLFNNVVEFTASSGLDGVDIEYPGMRGLVCGTWNTSNDGPFVNFVQGAKMSLPNKIFMLTVGVNSVSAIITGLSGYIDFLNIETYHYSLYPSNTNNATYPNSPYTIFAQAYSNWNENGAGINNDKIIMGVDFGNTVQVVTNNNIMTNQSVEYNYNPQYDVKSNLPPEVTSQLIPIGGYCNNQPTMLYSWPWKSLSAYALNSSTCFCTTESGWTRKFDQVNHNPWLYKVFGPNTSSAFYFVSYEDFSSLHDKLSLLATGGISISNISYDDNNNSLLNYIRSNKLPPFVELPNSDNSGSGGETSSNPTNADDQKSLDKHHAGVIAGAVVGSISLFLLVVSSLIWYRRKTLVKSKDPNSIPKGPMKSHTTTKNAEMSSDSSPNRFAVPTTVTPVEPSHVTAMFDFEGKEKDDLSFKKGDKIEVLERGDGPNDWWIGRINGTVGEFPGNYVKETV